MRMKMKILLALVAVAALGVGGFLAVRYTRQVGDTLMSDPQAGGAKPKITFIKDPGAIPELTMKTLDGRTLSNKDLRGKVTLVNFWATWCPPCREEIPDLIKLQERFKDHLVIIGVSSDEGSSEMVAKFAAEHRMNYPIVMETPELTRAFPGIFALPTTFIVDPDLKMVKKHVGRLNPGIVELETRVLAKLPVDAQVERVADNTQAILSGNAQATDVPGVDLASLSPAQKTVALKRLNEEKCTCGCGFTLAQCRINDTTCGVSLPIAETIVAEIRAGR
jgi:thiol-disulfide isomerase/thioredoxin